MKVFKDICFLCLLFASLSVGAQESQKKSGLLSRATLEYRIKAGFNIGGSSPLPLPAEIRELKSYNPGLNISLEGNIIKWFDKQWGALIGVRFESKGMNTDARVKNYFLIMNTPEQGRLEGIWTGNVKTEVKSTSITIPLQAMYKVSPRWDLKFGPYISFLPEKKFTGSSYDGYLREGNPTGDKIVIEGEEANYDFSDDLQTFQWGIDLGAEWKVTNHLIVYSDLTWSVNPLFAKEFRGISFDMYNIYLNVGFGYTF